jgi:hypothetical protein
VGLVVKFCERCARRRCDVSNGFDFYDWNHSSCQVCQDIRVTTAQSPSDSRDGIETLGYRHNERQSEARSSPWSKRANDLTLRQSHSAQSQQLYCFHIFIFDTMSNWNRQITEFLYFSHSTMKKKRMTMMMMTIRMMKRKEKKMMVMCLWRWKSWKQKMMMVMCLWSSKSWKSSQN